MWRITGGEILHSLPNTGTSLVSILLYPVVSTSVNPFDTYSTVIQAQGMYSLYFMSEENEDTNQLKKKKKARDHRLASVDNSPPPSSSKAKFG